MSDWEDENDVAIDNVPKKQPPPQTNWTRFGVQRENVPFGMRPARHQRADEQGAREPGERDRGRVFRRSRVFGEESRPRPLVFNVEKTLAGRIIGKHQSL